MSATLYSNTEFQKNPGKIAKSIAQKGGIITSHGKPTMLVLPYFEESAEWADQYLEDFEIWKNKQTLQQELQASQESGISDFSL